MLLESKKQKRNAYIQELQCWERCGGKYASTTCFKPVTIPDSWLPGRPRHWCTKAERWKDPSSADTAPVAEEVEYTLQASEGVPGVRIKSQADKKEETATSGRKSPLHVMKCFITNLVNLSRLSSSYASEPKTETVLFDSGANCCITNRMDDFAGDYDDNITDKVIDGIGKGLKVEGAGTVAWTFEANNGLYRTLRLPCYYVPSTNTRIASLQRVLEAYPNEQFTMD